MSLYYETDDVRVMQIREEEESRRRRERMAEVAERVERKLLVKKAMWDLLAPQLGLTEDDLAQRIAELAAEG